MRAHARTMHALACERMPSISLNLGLHNDVGNNKSHCRNWVIVMTSVTDIDKK